MNKKISLDVLKIILTPWEMKNVTGGSNGGDGISQCCFWQSLSSWDCTDSEAEAAHMGTYHWACNNNQAYQYCSHKPYCQ